MTSITAHPHGIRLGHALGDRSSVADDAAVRFAVAVANGDATLDPRLPVDPAAVLGAERILGAGPRPVYAFLGSLHPDLGHGLEYDAEVALRDELHLSRSCHLAQQYRSLARSLSRANADTAKMLGSGGDESHLPSWVGK